METTKSDMDRKLQEATLEAIKKIVDNTDKQVSYDVYTSVERVNIFKKDTVVKTHINITITDTIADTTPSARRG